MIRWAKLFGNQYLGFWVLGLVLFVVQEIPYIVMSFFQLESNPIMNMTNEIKWIETVQGIFGILSMIILMLIVRDDVKLIPIETTKDKTFLFLTILMILINFVGWILYYMGHQYGWLIIISQFAVVPLYYLFFGLWKSNYLLVGTAVLFFVIHTINGIINFAAKR